MNPIMNAHVPRALVAEDHDEMRRMVAAVLRAAGFSVVAVADGEALIEQAHQNDGDVDVIISDVSMPKLNGLSALQRIHRHYPDVPMIVMSAYASVDEIRTAAQHVGAVEVIVKPLDLIELRRTVERVVAG